MKNIINLVKVSFLLGGLFVFAGCDNEPEVSGISRVTYFPEFVYDGPDQAVIPCNSDYQISPVTATENGQPLTVSTRVATVNGTVPSVDINTPEHYIETSTAINADGFPATVQRQFWVACSGDLVNSIEGLYSSTVIRSNAVNPQYFDMKYVLIRKVGDNVYEISDAIGGYYEFGRLYGWDYRAVGTQITANNIASNDFSFSGPIGVGAFGGVCQMTTMTVDAAAKTIHFVSDWDAGTAQYVFEVTLTQVQL
jgi:hypothetical protein